MPKLTPLGFQKQLREACTELSKTMSEEDWNLYQVMLIRDIANTRTRGKKTALGAFRRKSDAS